MPPLWSVLFLFQRKYIFIIIAITLLSLATLASATIYTILVARERIIERTKREVTGITAMIELSD